MASPMRTVLFKLPERLDDALIGTTTAERSPRSHFIFSEKPFIAHGKLPGATIPITMRVLIVSHKVGDLYGQEKIVSASTLLLRRAGHQVEWVGESCSGSVVADAFHQVPELFHLNSFSGKTRASAAMEQLWRVAGEKNDGTTLLHFLDHLDPRVFVQSAKRFPTVFTAHTAAATCPASGRVVKGLPVCPQKSGWSCLKHHYRYHCLSAQRTPLHRANVVYEFQKKHEGLKAVHRLFSVSHFLQEQLMREGYRKGKIAYVPNPITVRTGLPKVEVPENLFVGAARLVPPKRVSPRAGSL